MLVQGGLAAAHVAEVREHPLPLGFEPIEPDDLGSAMRPVDEHPLISSMAA